MIEIRNLLFQPLTFQLAGEQRGLHLGARQRRPVEDAQVSEEIRTAAKRGIIALVDVAQSEQPEAQQNEEPAAQVTEEATPAVEDNGSGSEPEIIAQPDDASAETSTKKRSKS